jgi:hypothetical protein
MKLRLSTWNAILLGPFVLAAQYLTTPNVSPANRAVAMGILLYLALPALVVLIVDAIKLRRLIVHRKENS